METAEKLEIIKLWSLEFSVRVSKNGGFISELVTHTYTATQHGYKDEEEAISEEYDKIRDEVYRLISDIEDE